LGFHETCREAGISPLAGALASVQTREWIAEVVIGVTSAAELKEVVDVWHVPLRQPRVISSSEDLSLIDPRNWA
jgi:aryl-alcohol dehydrogenase-like predicted oxidoreductase